MSSSEPRLPGVAVSVVAALLVGGGAIAIGLRYAPMVPGGAPDATASAAAATAPAFATEEYGRRLVANTAELLGPDRRIPRAGSHPPGSGWHADAVRGPGD